MQILNLKLGELLTNCYIITDEQSNETAVIDPGEYDLRLENIVKNKNVKYILLTHGHSDHISGVSKLKALTGAKVVMSKDEICFIDGCKLNLSDDISNKVERFSVDIAVNNGDTLYLGKAQIKVLATPGHTIGGVCYVIERDRLIFTGDTLFKLSVGRTDFPTGNYKEIISSVKKIAALEGNYDVFPGHENKSCLDYERKNNMYLNRGL